MNNKNILIQLFGHWSGEKVKTFSPLPESGSPREYFRISSENITAIGVFNLDNRENKAFIYLTKHFFKKGLNVPKLYTTELLNNIYLLQDLGDQTLFSFAIEKRKGDSFSQEIIDYYKRVIEELPHFQILGAKGLDYSYCYPRSKFDKQSMFWDLNYFKYYFLKLANIPFNEQKLEDDFKTLTNFLLQADCNFFMYRDFNSRNVMIKDGELYFIDYQGGRKGALQYDIASLLFDSKANIPFKLREEFLEHYIASVQKIRRIDKSDFQKYYHGYVLIRLLQMFGAYGYRGFFEGKAHFLQSVPFALNNLEWLFEQNKIKFMSKSKIPDLKMVLEKMIQSKELKTFEWKDSYDGKLTVRINSFSYKDKIPIDLSGNGGGFVFDCRVIPNPGRIEQYKPLTGKDKPVQDFLDTQPDVQKFLSDSFGLVDQSVQNYIDRKWTDLMVNYGCTGGQHRSVYCVERLAKHLQAKFDINVNTLHTNLASNKVTELQSKRVSKG